MKKVLMIEDDPDQVILYRTALRLAGFEVVTANNGTAGVARATEWLPDLILSDVVMDGISGLQVLQQLKANPATIEIPVILLTNVFKSELVDKAKSAGAAAVWEKTKVMPTDVVRRVKALLRT